MVAGTASAAAQVPRVRRSLKGRLVATFLRSAAATLQRLPDGPLHRAAYACGLLLYHLQPGRRKLVRANLERVCRYLLEHGLTGPSSPAGLATGDARALERLVRAAFGHYARSYLEVAIMPAYAAQATSDYLLIDDPELLEEAFGFSQPVRRPAIVVGLHFGAIEIPGLWGTQRGLRVTSPMETLADPDLQSYFTRSRGATGLRLIPPQGAGRELVAALGRGETVAIVADRVVAGAGARTELFGGPARLPLGPAVLALETGAPAWLVAARRTGWGRYGARLERIELPAEGSRRERLAAFLAAQARAFERAIAAAPEQWWALFFPIWQDERR
jgi:phosphatidylinositol dimannoside acyltransferase